MSHYELEQLNRRIYELNLKIEYLYEHPAIIELNRRIEELERRIEALEEEIENLKEEQSEKEE
jgi:predicted  nucleic acid-binding Zn-ribbon protein